MHSQIFIEEKHRNLIETLVGEEIYPPRFKTNLKEILTQTYTTFTAMMKKFQNKIDKGEGPESTMPKLPGMEDPKPFSLEDDKEQIMKKIAYERYDISDFLKL